MLRFYVHCLSCYIMLLLVVLWTLSLIRYGRHTNCAETHARAGTGVAYNQTARNAMTSPIPLSTVTRVSTISTYHSLLPVLFVRLSWQATFLQGRTPLVVLSRLHSSQYVGLILHTVWLKYHRQVLLVSETFTSFVCFLVFPSSWEATVTCFYSAKSNQSFCSPTNAL